MKDYWKEEKSKKINKKKIITAIIIVFIIAVIIAITIIYRNNKKVSNWIDKVIFRKEVMQDKVTTIELKEDQNSNIYAFNKYIGVLDKNQFFIYGNTGNEEKSLEIQYQAQFLANQIDFLESLKKKGKKYT